LLLLFLPSLLPSPQDQIFAYPVDVEQVPDYAAIVKRPMDLDTLGMQLEQGEREIEPVRSTPLR
jgi:hypothetical protein